MKKAGESAESACSPTFTQAICLHACLPCPPTRWFALSPVCATTLFVSFPSPLSDARPLLRRAWARFGVEAARERSSHVERREDTLHRLPHRRPQQYPRRNYARAPAREGRHRQRKMLTR